MDPKIPLDELRRRYEALGPIEEMPGERTALGRCSTFSGFLAHGPIIAPEVDWYRNLPEGQAHPELFDLIAEAWPLRR